MIKKIFLASRPVTLSISVLSVCIGIFLSAKTYISISYFLAFLTLIAAILMQAAMNMMNNFFDETNSLVLKKIRFYNFCGYKRSKDEILTFKVGIFFYIIVFFIGLYLSYISRWELFLIEILGLFMAYSYDGMPLRYKKLGLGPLLSFIMMGLLLPLSSFIVFTKTFSYTPIFYGFTFGLLIPVILIGNELRDFDEDLYYGVYTLSIRIGYLNAKKLFYSLIFFAYFNILILYLINLASIKIFIVYLSLISILKVDYYLNNNKSKIVPYISKCFLLYTSLLILSLCI